MPIVIVGSMAMSMNVTGPIQTTEAKRIDKPKTTPSELGKSIRDAFSAAKRVAVNPNAAAVTPGAATVAASAPATYRVAAGDTVSSIAGRYGLATASVLALNGLSWKSVIFPGQVLKLAGGGATPIVSTPASSSSSRYTIQRGDTIGGIAAKFGLATQTLLSANGLGWGSIIYPGQTIGIPATTAAAASSTPAPVAAAAKPVTVSTGSYVVQSGDTVSKIASKFGVSVQDLLTANGLGWSSIIYTGHSLKIPGATAVLASSITPIVSSSAPSSSSPQTALTAEMTTNAKTIIRIGKSLGVPDYGLVIALSAAAQESGLRNLTYGDRDSIGLFQQRPSAGWGTRTQLLDTTYATRLFFGGKTNPNKANTRGLLDIPGWQSKTVTQAAQAVQLSAYPTAYAKWETAARSWLAQLG
ncbi:muramidase family protein [Lacisediminihabitans sp.]|uniref:muramidase family protein n=1 Tax=Lacisediminihabitans sp. TaxID=2787631 RepID=UPI002EDA3804